MAKRLNAKPLVQPNPDQVRAARLKAELNQTDAAALVYLSGQARWAEYESGVRNIDLARWELFLIKTGQR